MSRREVDVEALTSLVEDSGLVVHRNSRSWIFNCPRCSKPKLYIRRTDGQGICWKCAADGMSGAPEYLLTEILGVSVATLAKKLYGDDVYIRVPKGSLVLPPLEDFFDDLDPIPPYLLDQPKALGMPLDFASVLEPAGAKGMAYLAKRGVSEDLAAKYDLQYHPEERRVIFPIYLKKDLIGWQARTIESATEDAKGYPIPKILTPPGVDKSKMLMFANRLDDVDHAIIDEGPMDALKGELCGGAVATLGKWMSGCQVQLIRKRPNIRRIYLGQDPDAAEEINRLCKEFAGYELYRMLPLRGYEDLGAMSPEENLESFRSARRITRSSIFLPPLFTPPAVGFPALAEAGDLDA